MNTSEMTNKVFGKGRLAFIGILLTLLMATACNKNNVQAAPAMPAPLVTVVKATAQDVPKYLDEIGRNAAFESVTVTPQVGRTHHRAALPGRRKPEEGATAVCHRSSSVQGAGRFGASGAGAGEGGARSGEDPVRT